MKIKVFVTTIGIAAAVGLTGCGSTQTQIATTQQETTTAVTDQIIGMWKVYKMSYEGEETVDKPYEDESYFTFYEDGTMTALDKDTPETGTWKKASPDSYIVTIDDYDHVFTIKDGELVMKVDLSMDEDHQQSMSLVMKKE